MQAVNEPTECGCAWLRKLAAYQPRFAWTSGTRIRATTLALPPRGYEAGESILPDEPAQGEGEPSTVAKVPKGVQGFHSMGNLGLEQAKEAQQEDPDLAEGVTWVHENQPSGKEIRAKPESIQEYHRSLGSPYTFSAYLGKTQTIEYRVTGELISASYPQATSPRDIHGPTLQRK